MGPSIRAAYLVMIYMFSKNGNSNVLLTAQFYSRVILYRERQYILNSKVMMLAEKIMGINKRTVGCSQSSKPINCLRILFSSLKSQRKAH